jgi:hypothetical protein
MKGAPVLAAWARVIDARAGPPDRSKRKSKKAVTTGTFTVFPLETISRHLMWDFLV